MRSARAAASNAPSSREPIELKTPICMSSKSSRLLHHLDPIEISAKPHRIALCLLECVRSASLIHLCADGCCKDFVDDDCYGSLFLMKLDWVAKIKI